jgi:hypothetical protein
MTNGDDPEGDQPKHTASAAAEPGPQTEIHAAEIKHLLNILGSGPTNLYVGSGNGAGAKPVKELAEDLPTLPPNLHPFRDPRHDQLVKDLERRRILVLTSYQENAAYAAGYSLVTDAIFGGRDSCGRKALFPTRGRDKDRADLDLLALTDKEFLGEKPQIMLIEIDSRCTILDSARSLPSSMVGTIRDRLESHRSYLVLAINEELFGKNAAAERVPCYSVSHLRYLLAPDLGHRAEELERRLLNAVERGAGVMELQELYRRVADRLSQGLEAFENLLRELEETRTLPLAERKQRLQPISAQKVVDDGSDVHRATAFVATYFPEIGQRDFERLVLTLLGRQTTTVECVRQTLGPDGTAITIREESEQRWSERWERSPDQIFLDCHLRTIVAADGSWAVDFSEPYLRRELRAHFERQYPWYLRRQCRTLQDCGIFFAADLSAAAVDALVRLFVERAIIDPVGSGSVWLIDLVGGLKIQLEGEPPSNSPEATLVWLLEKLAFETQLRAHFYGRLALLLREMLEREALRPMVREFFEFLIAARQHDALLDLVLELARRLRFAPHFDPLVWMRRLLDQGSAAVRERTANRLIALARESGPRIYEFLASVQSWLPEAGRPPERFSVSNQVALEFPFAYCFDIARRLPDRQLGVWPSLHPLFYALSPPDTSEARREIANLVAWIMDPRGAVLETGDKSDPARTAEAARIGFVADLIAHWSWVLLGGTGDGPPEGQALFHVILEEIDRRIGARERVWLQRSWQRRQDEYLAEATRVAGPARARIVARRARLDQLRQRFAELTARLQTPGSTQTNAGGTAP